MKFVKSTTISILVLLISQFASADIYKKIDGKHFVGDVLKVEYKDNVISIVPDTKQRAMLNFNQLTSNFLYEDGRKPSFPINQKPTSNMVLAAEKFSQQEQFAESAQIEELINSTLLTESGIQGEISSRNFSLTAFRFTKKNSKGGNTLTNSSAIFIPLDKGRQLLMFEVHFPANAAAGDENLAVELAKIGLFAAIPWDPPKDSVFTDQNVIDVYFRHAHDSKVGNSVQKNTDTQIYWLEQALLNGGVTAGGELARLYAKRDDSAGKMIFLHQVVSSAIERGDVSAVRVMADFYAVGLGVEQNSEKSEQLFREAATKGDGNAQFIVAMNFSTDFSEKITFLTKASEQGLDYATAELEKLMSGKNEWKIHANVGENSDRCFAQSESLKFDLFDKARAQPSVMVNAEKDKPGHVIIRVNLPTEPNRPGKLVIDNEEFIFFSPEEIGEGVFMPYAKIDDKFSYEAFHEMDKRLIAAMKRGLKMSFEFVSLEDGVLVDHYELKGFTKAFDASRSGCNK